MKFLFFLNKKQYFFISFISMKSIFILNVNCNLLPSLRLEVQISIPHICCTKNRELDIIMVVSDNARVCVINLLIILSIMVS